MRLREVLGEIPIYGIKHTTLFERVAEYGREWLITVNHQKPDFPFRQNKLLLLSE